MNIHSTIFSSPFNTDYTRLANVMIYSATEVCPFPETTYRVDQIDLHAPDRRRRFLHKIENWAFRVQNEPDGAELLLLDADMLILRDPGEIFTERRFDWDIALVRRNPQLTTIPINTGAVWVRVSNLTRQFFAEWHAVLGDMLDEPGLHRHTVKRYGDSVDPGDQGAFGVMELGLVDSCIDMMSINWLPDNWNLCQEAWQYWSTAGIIHIKGNLRKEVFKPNPAAPAHLKRIADLWRNCEKRMHRHHTQNKQMETN